MKGWLKTTVGQRVVGAIGTLIAGGLALALEGTWFKWSTWFLMLLIVFYLIQAIAFKWYKWDPIARKQDESG